MLSGMQYVFPLNRLFRPTDNRLIGFNKNQNDENQDQASELESRGKISPDETAEYRKKSGYIAIGHFMDP